MYILNKTINSKSSLKQGGGWRRVDPLRILQIIRFADVMTTPLIQKFWKLSQFYMITFAVIVLEKTLIA